MASSMFRLAGERLFDGGRPSLFSPDPSERLLAWFDWALYDALAPLHGEPQLLDWDVMKHYFFDPACPPRLCVS